jgi:hypothetical protein
VTGPLALDAVAGLLLLVVLYAAPRVIFAVLVGSLLLVPATLVVPHLHSSYVTLNHLLIAGAAIRLLLMSRQGRRELIHGTPLHLALALLLVIWTADGLVFAPTGSDPSLGLTRLLNLGFVALFFVVTLGLLRIIKSPRFAVSTLVGAFGVAVAIAVVEHFTHQAYGERLFNYAGAPFSTTAAGALESRAGHLRVRSSAEFALAFGWLEVMLVPLLTVWAIRLRRDRSLLGLAVLAATGLTIYWTYARSAAAAVPLILVLLALVIRERKTALLASSTVIVSVGIFLADPTLRNHLSLSTDQGSVGVRFQRLPPILDSVAQHAYLGLGIGGLQSIGVPVTDNFYLYSYGDTGAVGAAVLVAMCLTALVQTGRGLRLQNRNNRALVATCLIGLVAFLISGLVDDALLLAQPAELVMLLIAIASATAETELGFAQLPTWSIRRIGFLSAAGALIGLAALLLSPVRYAQERTFSTVSALRNTGQYDAVTSGTLLIATVCDIAKSIQPSLPSTHISCLDDFGAAGVGTLRIEAASRTNTLAAYRTLTSTLHNSAYYLQAFSTAPSTGTMRAVPSGLRTAPASGAALGAAIGCIAPWPIRRRREDEDADEAAVPTPV